MPAGLAVLTLANLALEGPLATAGLARLAILILLGVLVLAASILRWRREGRVPFAEPAPPLRAGGDGVILVLLLALAIAFRCLGLGELWSHVDFDEGINADIIQGILDGDPPPPVLDRYVHGEESLPYFLMAACRVILGPGVDSMRLASALAGALCIPLVYLLVRRFASPMPAALAAVLLAADPWHLYLSRRINTFSFASTAAVLTAVLLLWAVERRDRPALVLAGAALGMGFHTYPAFRIVPPAILLALPLSKDLRQWARSPRDVGLYLGTALLMASPVLVASLEEEGYWARPIWKSVLHLPLEGAVSQLFQNLWIAARLILGLQFLEPQAGLVPSLVLGLCGAALAALLLTPRFGLRHWAVLIIAALWALIPALVVRYSMERANRYIFAIPAWYVLAGAGAAAVHQMLSSPRLRAAAWLLIFAGLALSRESYIDGLQTVGRYTEDSWVEEIRQIHIAGDLARTGRVVIPETMIEGFEDVAELTYNLGPYHVARSHELETYRGLAVLPYLNGAPHLDVLVQDPSQESHLLDAYEGAQRRVIERDFGGRTGKARFIRIPWDAGRLLRGLTFSARGPEDDASRQWAPVRGLDLPPFEGGDTPDRGWRESVWSGWVYVPSTGVIRFKAQGPVLQSIRIGPYSTSPVGTLRDLKAEMEILLSEGYHPFRLEASGKDALLTAPPRLLWSRTRGVGLAEIPSEYFARRLPDRDFLEAVEVDSEWPWTLAERALLPTPLTPRPGEEAFQELALHEGRLYWLTGRPPMWLERTGLDLRRDEDWHGLADMEPLVSPAAIIEDDIQRMGLALTHSGHLFVTSESSGLILQFDQQGKLLGELDLPWTGRPRAADTDEVDDLVYISDQMTRRIFVLDESGRLLRSWPAPPSCSLAAAPWSEGVYAAHPDLGRIVHYAATGEIRASWRTAEVTKRTRLALHPSGYLLVLIPEKGAIFVYSTEGVLMGPPLPIPPDPPEAVPLLRESHGAEKWPLRSGPAVDGEIPDLRNLVYLDLEVDRDGTIFVAYGPSPVGARRFELVRRPKAAQEEERRQR